MNKPTELVHDQSILDFLADRYGEDAADTFGNCTDDLRLNTSDTDLLIARANTALESIGTPLRVVKLAGADDNGYYWEIYPRLSVLMG